MSKKKNIKLTLIGTFLGIPAADELNVTKLRKEIYLVTKNVDPLRWMESNKMTDDFIRHCEAKGLKKRNIIRMLWPLGVTKEDLCPIKNKPKKA